MLSGIFELVKEKQLQKIILSLSPFVPTPESHCDEKAVPSVVVIAAVHSKSRVKKENFNQMEWWCSFQNVPFEFDVMSKEANGGSFEKKKKCG